MKKDGRKSALPVSAPELIVVMKKEQGAQSPLKKRGLAPRGKSAITRLKASLTAQQINLVPLFPGTEALPDQKAAAVPAGEDVSRMSVFYKVEAPANADVDAIMRRLSGIEAVEGAYIKPGAQPPVYPEDGPGKLRNRGIATPLTNDLTTNQGYLNSAPAGVDARYAWTLPGGRGEGINVIDIEGGWNFRHEDLVVNSGGLISGNNNSADLRWFNHGTAVLGVFSGDTNAFGVSGISPKAKVRTVSIFDAGSAAAIKTAADALKKGDVMLIELHRGGPAYPGGNSQLGFIGIEWWPDDFEAIRYATSKGIIVVEAAGNGSQNLDDPLYDAKPQGFPSWWSNPFRRSAGMDSGAILVGAGAPPPGPNGNWGPDRSRLGFSNYGQCIDAQGWGQGVTTCGYGDIHGSNASNKNEWYTNFFNGTSSASPVIVGTVTCLQGIMRSARRAPITPARMRKLLRSTGSPQRPAPGTPVSQHIGRRPNLRQLVKAVTIA